MQKNKNPFISVVIPAYNAERYIDKAIDSILLQSYYDFELIIVDDGSTDHTLSILYEWAKHDSRIRVFSRVNSGISSSLNFAIRKSRGVWIARMDSDDISVRTRLEDQLNYAQQHDLDLLGSSIFKFRSSNRLHNFLKCCYPVKSDDICLQLGFNSAFAHPSVLIKKSLAVRFPYDHSFTHIEDYELWCRIAASEKVAMGNHPGFLLYYRKANSQVSTKNKQSLFSVRKSIALKYASSSSLCRPYFSFIIAFHEHPPGLENALGASVDTQRILSVLMALSLTKQGSAINLPEIIAINLFNYLAWNVSLLGFLKCLKLIDVLLDKKRVLLLFVFCSVPFLIRRRLLSFFNQFSF